METPRPGDILAAKYRVEGVIGEGGMGVVLAATHLQLQQPVAIKLMRTEAISRGEAMARFLREARAAASIQSDHVCRVLDVATLEDGSPYIVMEFMRGTDLAGELERRGRVEPGEAVDAILQACEALAEAHAAGIVHRDLKPANLFLANRPDGSSRLKVLDFGISKWRDEAAGPEDVRLTRQNTTLGSPLYMSPEQMKSARDVDARADVWALGAILYEMLAGRPPFDGSSVTEVCAKIVQDEPAALDGIDPGLGAAVLRCLAKDRDARWQNVGQLAAALAPYAGRLGAASAERASRLVSSDPSRPSIATSRPAVESRTALGPTVASLPVSPALGPRKRGVAVVAGLGVIVVGAAAFALRGAASPPAEAPAPPPSAAAVAPAPPPAAPDPAPSAIAPVGSAAATASAAALASAGPKPVTVAPASVLAAGNPGKKPATNAAGAAVPAPAPPPAPTPSPLDTAGFGGRK